MQEFPAGGGVFILEILMWSDFPREPFSAECGLVVKQNVTLTFVSAVPGGILQVDSDQL